MTVRALFVMIAVFCGINFSCKEHKTVNFNPGAAKSELSQANTLAVANILKDYYSLKNALVATNSKKAITAAGEMQQSVIHFKNRLVDSSLTTTQTARFQDLTGQLMGRLTEIEKASDGDCERMRIYFKPLSDYMYDLLKETQMANIQAYHHYCPMAMNEHGAYWLSASPDIENPYFGQKMLTCGELVDTIK